MYKENVRVNEALSYHMLEGDKLKSAKERLEKENAELQGELEMNEMLIQDKVSQSKQQKSLLKEVKFLFSEKPVHYINLRWKNIKSGN